MKFILHPAQHGFLVKYFHLDLVKSGAAVLSVAPDRCPKCGSANRKPGEYTRAWNALCNQAAGEFGHYCMDCHFIDFRTPDFETWLSTTPRWIVRHYGDAWRKE